VNEPELRAVIQSSPKRIGVVSGALTLMRAFVGNINPAQDISAIRLAIVAESREHLADATQSLARYGTFEASIDYH
jgi:hypothetical protein